MTPEVLQHHLPISDHNLPLSNLRTITLPLLASAIASGVLIALGIAGALPVVAWVPLSCLSCLFGLMLTASDPSRNHASHPHLPPDSPVNEAQVVSTPQPERWPVDGTHVEERLIASGTPPLAHETPVVATPPVNNRVLSLKELAQRALIRQSNRYDLVTLLPSTHPENAHPPVRKLIAYTAVGDLLIMLRTDPNRPGYFRVEIAETLSDRSSYVICLISQCTKQYPDATGFKVIARPSALPGCLDIRLLCGQKIPEAHVTPNRVEVWNPCSETTICLSSPLNFERRSPQTPGPLTWIWALPHTDNRLVLPNRNILLKSNQPPAGVDPFSRFRHTVSCTSQTCRVETIVNFRGDSSEVTLRVTSGSGEQSPNSLKTFSWNCQDHHPWFVDIDPNNTPEQLFGAQVGPNKILFFWTNVAEKEIQLRRIHCGRHTYKIRSVIVRDGTACIAFDHHVIILKQGSKRVNLLHVSPQGQHIKEVLFTPPFLTVSTVTPDNASCTVHVLDVEEFKLIRTLYKGPTPCQVDATPTRWFVQPPAGDLLCWDPCSLDT